MEFFRSGCQRSRPHKWFLGRLELGCQQRRYCAAHPGSCAGIQHNLPVFNRRNWNCMFGYSKAGRTNLNETFRKGDRPVAYPLFCDLSLLFWAIRFSCQICQNSRLHGRIMRLRKGTSLCPLVKKHNGADSIVYNGVHKIIFGSRFDAWII